MRAESVGRGLGHRNQLSQRLDSRAGPRRPFAACSNFSSLFFFLTRFRQALYTKARPLSARRQRFGLEVPLASSELTPGTTGARQLLFPQSLGRPGATPPLAPPAALLAGIPATHLGAWREMGSRIPSACDSIFSVCSFFQVLLCIWSKCSNA